MKYLKFVKEVESNTEDKGFFAENLLCKILTAIFPKANPDYDHLCGLVKTWYIEYDETYEEDGTVREIGRDSYGRIIIKGPDSRNYGFGNDTNMGISDFIEQMHAEYIKQEEFESVWNEELRIRGRRLKMM